MKKILKRATACMMALTMCTGMMHNPIVASANNDMDMRYIVSTTTPTSENKMYGPSKAVDTENIPAITEGYTHVHLGSGNLSDYWMARLNVSTDPNEKIANVFYTDENTGARYYGAAKESVFVDRGLLVNGLYIDGTYIEGVKPAMFDSVQQFILADASTKELITTYCADMDTPAKAGYAYNMENVEDADYYDEVQAAKIRSVALNGYWGTESGVGSLTSVKALMQASGQFTEEEVEALTDGMAMTATQYAIWSFSNAMSSQKFVNVYGTKQGIDPSWGNNYKGFTYEGLDEDAALIMKLYYYLADLAPTLVENTTADTIITKDNVLKNLDIEAVEKIEGHTNNLDDNKDNDAYYTNLSFVMEVIPLEGNDDNLVAKVLDAEENVLAIGRIAGEPQEGEVVLEADTNGKYTFTNLEMIEGTQTLNVALEGVQHLKQGVYLYSSEVKANVPSQTMVGIAEGTRQVDVEFDWEVDFDVDDRVLHIYKYSNVSEADPIGNGTQAMIDTTVHTKALANVSFSIYKVCDLDALESVNGAAPALVLDKEPSNEDVAKYAIPENKITTVTTDALGHAFFNFGQNNVDGVYLVVEEANPSVAAPAKPFYVSMPMTNPNGDGWLYNVYVYPKNDLEPAPGIDKDVVEVGNDYGTFDMDDIFTYIIRGEIPEGLATAKVYALSDTLDTRLDYKGNVVVKVYNEEQKEITLIKNRHYILTETAASGENGAYMKVNFTKDGMKYVMDNLGADVESVEPEIRVYFDATLNVTADLGTKIPNNARIDYTNATGYVYETGVVPVEERPEVETGGINILKYNATDAEHVLADAQFILARDAKESDTADIIQTLIVNGDSKDVVYVDFYDAEGNKISQVTTDEDGTAEMYGLEYGTYYLVETKAPEGFNLLTKPVVVTISNTSHTAEEVLKVANSNKFKLPSTGGIGTTIFTTSGMMMVAAAAVVLVMKKKEEEEA